jgi:hypothetical protein
MNPNAMVEMFQALPPDRQEAVRNWMMIQRAIAEHAGITREEWFELIQEALDHPLDFGFVEACKPGAFEETNLEAIDATKKKLGERGQKTALEGEGIVAASQKGALEKELFQRFQAQKLAVPQNNRRKPAPGRGRTK